MLNENNPGKKRLKIFHLYHILALALTVLQNTTKISHNYFDDVSGNFILQGDCNLTCKSRGSVSFLTRQLLPTHLPEEKNSTETIHCKGDGGGISI